LPQYTLWTGRQTDQPTDGLDDRSVPRPTYAQYIDYNDVAINLYMADRIHVIYTGLDNKNVHF